MSKATDTETRAFKARWKDALDEFKSCYTHLNSDAHAWIYKIFFEQGWKTCKRRMQRQAARKGKENKS